MAVYINGSSANEVFYSDVSLAGYVFYSVQLLAQTIYFKQGTATSGNTVSGDICLFGGYNPLITSPTVASDGTIPANSTSYGFGISATRSGTTMANAKGICDDAYSGGYYAAAVITDSGGVTVGISITVPFSNYTLVGIGYVQAPVDIKIHYIYIDGSHGTKVPVAHYNAGNCTYMSVNINYTTNTFTLFTNTGTYQNDIGTAYHYYGDVVFVLSLPRSQYIAWKNGSYKPPVHLNSNASIVRD